MPEPLLVADDVGKVYGTDVTTRALDHVSFQVDGGEFASIIGKSGSGKSTLLNILGLLDTPTTGTLTLEGRDPGAMDKRARAGLRNRMIGFVFQFHYLLPEFSVWENVLMPTAIAGKPLDADLRSLAEETLAILGLEGLEDKNANELSGGQKQRVAVGRALVNRPPLILADEPTGNLDTENTEAVYGLFRRVNVEWGTTFLIVTHDKDIAAMTDRILEICDGRLIQDARNVFGAPSADAVAPGYRAPGGGKGG
jgi:lipoprotein-releasing system ATP-binding protein